MGNVIVSREPALGDENGAGREGFLVWLAAEPLVSQRVASPTWDRRIAQVISQVGSPPALTTVTALLAASVGGLGAWRWAIVFVSVTVLIPLAYLIWLVKRGWVTDLDVRLRKQRIGPMLVALFCQVSMWLAMAALGAPGLLLALASAVLVQTLLVFWITLRWKVSVHGATAAAAAVFVWWISGAPWLLLAGVPAIAWSRVRLGRHTAPQVIVGSFLGAMVMAAMLLMMTGS
ncbi:MAG: hypothetical protein JXB35_16550 [Anaerolineae bacterium]|nr:hypothetical protein [Anaerolineae bacterium]